MIRELSFADRDIIYTIINKVASANRDVVPAGCCGGPYMPEQELNQEMRKMTFFGWEERGKVVAIMGIQPVKDAVLIRHGFVLPGYRWEGIAAGLLAHIKRMTGTRRLLVGTWADAIWAIKFYRAQGFKLIPDKEMLLLKYWDIPQSWIETSVVLGIEN